MAALTATGALLLLPSVAGAEPVPPYGAGSTSVTDPVHEESAQTASVPTTAAPAAAVPATDTDTPSSLPFTGGDVAGLAAIGAGALGVGLVVSRARRGANSRSLSELRRTPPAAGRPTEGQIRP